MIREEEIEKAVYSYSKQLENRMNGIDYFNQENVEYAFIDGIEWADNHPKSPWINVDDDLPCNHEELLNAKYETKQVFVLKAGDFPYIDYMLKIDGKWTWFAYKTSKFWMPIPQLPKKIGDKTIECDYYKKVNSTDIVEDNNTDYYIHKFILEFGISYIFIRKDGKGTINCDIINGWGFINNVAVRRYYQRHAICGEMLKIIESYFKNNLGISSFYLICANDWHITCYEKYGYIVSEDREGIGDNQVKMFKEVEKINYTKRIGDK